MVAETTDLAQRQRELWARLEQMGSVQNFRRGTLIYAPSQPAHTLYLLRAGQVGLQISAPSGRSLTVQVVEAGEAFGHSALAGEPTYDTVAEVLKPVRVVAVPRSAIVDALLAQPDLATPMIDLLAQYQRVVGRRLEEVAFKSVPARLASVLLDMAEPADEGSPSPQAARVPRRTHQQLAEMINAYRETVTKVINQFRDARLLDIDRSGITLLNPSRLRELSQS